MDLSLRHYQMDAVKNLENGKILCGGVGSGKSRISLAYFYIRVVKGTLVINNQGQFSPAKEPRDLYIITTAQKRDKKEWEEECVPFELEKSGIKVTVDSWNNVPKYVDVKDAFFIFDEDRVVGSGVWAKSFLTISKSNKWIILSATPGDKWEDYIAVFIANGFYKNRTEFKRRHIVYSPYCKNFPKVDHYVETRRLEKIRNYLLVDMDFERPTVPHHENIIVPYDKEKYKDVFKRRWNIFTDEPAMNASELCYVLRRVVNANEDRIHFIEDLSRKKEKLIIFYNFDYELEILKNGNYVKDTVVAEWNGHAHQRVPKSHRWIYLVQYAAGAEGWNCIETDTTVFYSQNYSYKVMQQASGRIDRLNTPFKDLYFYHIKSQSPIDIAIQRALKSKKKFNERNFVMK